MSPLECVHFRSHRKRRLQRGPNYFGRSLVNYLVLNDLGCRVAIVAILPGPRGQRVVTFIAFLHRHTPIEENFQAIYRRAGETNFLWWKLASVSCNICRLCLICASSSAPWPKYKKIRFVRFSSDTSLRLLELTKLQRSWELSRSLTIIQGMHEFIDET